jgi:nucleoid-associated protein YgaU
VGDGTPNGALSGGAGKVTLYKVKDGDTLSLITSQFYPEAGPDVTASFARFNRLNPPEFAIFPGDVLKVPEEKALH